MLLHSNGKAGVSLGLMFVVFAFAMPAVSFASIDSDLKYGSSGDGVRQLQQYLIDHHFLSGAPTGSFFKLTQNAVKAYQKSVQLPPTGFVGPMTRALVNKDLQSVAASMMPVAVVATSSAATSTDPVDNQISNLRDQTQKILDQIAGLHGGAVATSSLSQTYATSTTQFAFDPSWLNAIVNIYCMGRYDESLSSGTGIIIDPRGVILTNAHVAENYLYSEWPSPSLLDCYIRLGSPAYPQYRATLLYLPDEYERASINNSFKADDTTVYGKKDYALLLITGPTSSSVTMPKAFPFMPLYQGGALPVNTSVYLSGYAAEYQGAMSMLRGLYIQSTPATVNAQRAIGTSTVPDVLAFAGALVAQHGSSGGGVITQKGETAGMLTFLDKNYGDATGDRVLNAISSGYILRDFAADTGTPLSVFLAGDLLAQANLFSKEKTSVYQGMYAKILKDKGYYIPGVY